MKYRSILAAALLLSTLAGRAGAAIAHDHTGASAVTTGSPSTFTVSPTVSANTGVLLWITVEDTNSIVSVVGGPTWTFIGSAHDTFNARRLELWAGYTVSSMSGGTTITATLTNPAVHQEAIIYDSYTGVRTTSFVEALNEVLQNAQATFTGSVTTLHVNSLAVMACTGAQGGATATSGYTVGTFLTGISNTTLATVYGNSVVASPSTVTPGWNPFVATSGDTLSAALVDASVVNGPPSFSFASARL